MATDQIATARKLLDDADREYESGDVSNAYGRLWDAACLVVKVELERRGMDASSRQSMLNGVERFAEDAGDPSINGLYAVARACRSFSEFGFVTDYEFEFDRPRVHRFVNRMLELTDNSQT